MTGNNFDSAYSRRKLLLSFVEAGVTDDRVISQLIRDGKGIYDEAVLWDFKSSLPTLLKDVRENEDRKRKYDFGMHEIVKDAVSFYNSYGGYLVIGIDDQNRNVIGFSSNFDISDLNKKIQGATGHSVECIFRIIKWQCNEIHFDLGIIFIPRRLNSANPARFNKNSPTNERGEYAYRSGQFYFRQVDACRPAVDPEDFEFLFSASRRSFSEMILSSWTPLENNLPSRDSDLGLFVGRNEEIAQLWSWLADSFSPVKILSGLGGVGKTSIAYTFARACDI